MDVTPEQIRAARGLLRLGQANLAKRAQVSVMTVIRLENADGNERFKPQTIEAIRLALERAGAEFIPDGVRRRRAARPEARSLC
jgi:transcriptional regulator with XRE-family HTH domain